MNAGVARNGVAMEPAPLMARPTWIVAFMLHVVPGIAAMSGWFAIQVAELLPLYGFCAVFAGCGWRLRILKNYRIAALLEMSALFYLLAAGTSLSCAVLSALALPYTDAGLAAADRMLGFDWVAMFHLFHNSPNAAYLLGRAYEALNWAPQFLIVLLIIFRGPMLAWRFLTGWAICLLFTALVYIFFPAVSPFHHYGFDPERMGRMTARVSWELPEILGGLRTGTTRSLGLAQLAGIVSMPSFHAAAAILLIHGYALLRWLRWPAVLVFGVMFFSAVPVGGHYFVDIIAGFLLALLSIRCAGRIFDRLSTPDKAAGGFCPTGMEPVGVAIG